VYSNIVRLTVRLKVLVWLVLSPVAVLAQETVIRGKITDAFSGDPIPFVNVVFKGTSIGTTTDFDGNYVLRTTSPTDSLQASYIGYKPRTKVVQKGISQTINFQLEDTPARYRYYGWGEPGFCRAPECCEK
jgi:hypothetical protein